MDPSMNPDPADEAVETPAHTPAEAPPETATAEAAFDLDRELTDEEIAALAFGGADQAAGSELSDDEIAALLNGGISAAEEPAAPKIAVETVMAGSIVSQVSHQKLALISDRLRSRLTISLRKLVADNVDIADRVEIVRYGDYINRVPLPVIIGIAEAREWSGSIMVLADAALVHNLVELLMGGRKQGTAKLDQRQFTAIEHKMIERTIQIVLDDLGAVFSALSDVTFTVKATEVNPRFVGLARDSDVVIHMRHKVQIERRSGIIDVVLPRATLEPVREQLSQQRHGERGTADARWEERLKAQLVTTPVEVAALLPTRSRTVGEVVAWRVGTHIALDATPETLVDVVYGGMGAWRALTGQKTGRVAVCLEHKIMGDGPGPGGTG
jgi:flagellar motor switch protein FliM